MPGFLPIGYDMIGAPGPNTFEQSAAFGLDAGMALSSRRYDFANKIQVLADSGLAITSDSPVPVEE